MSGVSDVPMASSTTYQGDVRRSEPSDNGLFAGKKFWFSSSVPSRNHLIDQAINNGAQVVQLDKQADIKLVDHLKKNQAPDTYSYQYVEYSIRNAQLEDLENHRVGSVARVDRPVGSVVTASKGSRNKFTDEDDQLLYNWLRPYVDNGGAWRGNDIYKQLERVSPNHTYQSWRDRWMKYTQYQGRNITTLIDPFDRTDDQVEINPRSPKRRRIEDHANQQQANIGVPQSRQGHLQDQTSIAQVMGTTSSMPDPSVARIDKVQSPLKRETKKRSEPDVEPKPEVAAHAEFQVVETEPKIVELGDSSSEASDETSSKSSQDELDIVEPEVLRNGEDGVSADGSRLPLLFNFTQKEAHMLYKATCHILDGRPDKLDESWAGVAKEHGHTKDAWKKFFYEVIVPEYMHRNGIENEAQLETHYKAKVREERLRKAAEKREREAAEARATPMRRDEGNEDLTKEGPNIPQNQVDREEQTFEDDAKSTLVLEIAPVDMSSRGTAEHREMFRRSATPPSSTQHRLPKPNESRKLSQPRGSQSTSSQSKSTQISQPTPVSQSLPYEIRRTAVDVTDTIRVQYVMQTPENDRHRSTRTPLGGQESLPEQYQGETSRTDTEVHGFLRPLQPSQPLQPMQPLQPLQERIEEETRFVTQQSTGEGSDLTDTTDLEDIPFRDPTSPIMRFQSDSPLFVPEEPEETEQLEESTLEREQLLDAAEEDKDRINPQPVQLLNDVDMQSGGAPISEYAPSEVPSEGIPVEGQVRPSQAWGTVPDKKRVDETIQILDQDHIARQATSELDHGLLSASNVDIITSDLPPNARAAVDQEDETTEGEFETAPTDLRMECSPFPKENEAIEIGHKTNLTMRSALDTQALFLQPTQVPFTEMIAIPEPPDGWDDEETPVPTRKEIVNVNTNTHDAEDADWTMLPLPDLDLDQPDTAPPPAKESEDINMDEWLAAQSKTHPSVPNVLLKPLSHQALEVTSMNFDLADAVLTRMVQRFEKGKHPVNQSLQTIRKLPKKERKTAISKIVDELVPSDMRGCWTREDDEALLGVNGRDVKRAEDKHGEDGVRTRFEFLEMWHAE